MLLVCAGSDPGRVPFAIVSRRSGAVATVTGSEVCFTHVIDTNTTWHFTLIAASGDVARDIASKLSKRELYSIHPDVLIVAIVFRRDDWGFEPMWIGGDISQVGVHQSDYLQNGNKAYIHKKIAEQIAATDRHQHNNLEPTTDLPRRR